MPTSSLKCGVEPVLKRIEERILAAEARLAAGNPREKVEASGELEFLRQQKTGLERRLAALEGRPEGTWERVREWISEEAGILEGRVASWLARN